MNTMHSTSGMVGAADGDIMVTLNEHHHPTANYVRRTSQKAAARVSRIHFLFSAGGYYDADSQLRPAGAH